MDHISRPRSPYTSLRDFGAYQSDSLPQTPRTFSPQPPRLTLPARPVVSPLPIPRRSLFPWQYERIRPLLQNKKVRIALRLAITVGLLLLLFTSVSWSQLGLALLEARRSLLLISFIVGAGGVVLSSYQWRFLLRAMQIRVDLADLINLYVVGIAFSHLLPTGIGGDAIKALYVGKEARNRAGSTGAILMCRVTGFCGMLLIALPAFLLGRSYLPAALVNWFLLLGILAAGGVVLAVGLVFWLPEILLGRWTRLAPVLFFLQVGKILRDYLSRPLVLGIAIMYGCVFWCVAILNCFCYGHALGIVAPFSFYCLIVPLAALISLLPISINGFGLREGALVSAFTWIHVAPTSALLLALLMDAQALLFALFGGSIYLVFLRKQGLFFKRM